MDPIRGVAEAAEAADGTAPLDEATWLALRHRKVQQKQVDWHRDNPDAPYEPPTS